MTASLKAETKNGDARLGERTVARKPVGDKDNSVVAETIRWFQSDDMVAARVFRNAA